MFQTASIRKLTTEIQALTDRIAQFENILGEHSKPQECSTLRVQKCRLSSLEKWSIWILVVLVLGFIIFMVCGAIAEKEELRLKIEKEEKENSAKEWNKEKEWKYPLDGSAEEVEDYRRSLKRSVAENWKRSLEDVWKQSLDKFIESERKSRHKEEGEFENKIAEERRESDEEFQNKIAEERREIEEEFQNKITEERRESDEEFQNKIAEERREKEQEEEFQNKIAEEGREKCLERAFMASGGRGEGWSRAADSWTLIKEKQI